MLRGVLFRQKRAGKDRKLKKKEAEKLWRHYSQAHQGIDTTIDAKWKNLIETNDDGICKVFREKDRQGNRTTPDLHQLAQVGTPVDRGQESTKGRNTV